MAGLLLLLCLLLGCGVSAAFADGDSAEAEYTDMRIYFDGLLTGRGYVIDGSPYLPFEDICAFFGRKLSVLRDDGAASCIMTAPGLNISVPDGAEYLCVNNRYLYIPGGMTEIKGRLCLPAETVAKIFNLSFTIADDLSRIDVDSSEMSVITGGVTYYSDHFSSDEIFWLPRVIHAEAGNQPLAGRIGVGSVVLNRVSGDIYPDNVYDVIFDKEFCVQFEPVMRGTIYSEPDELSVISAYLCLEGYNTVGESQYFLNPKIADDSWFRSSLEFVTTIGDHDFYA